MERDGQRCVRTGTEITGRTVCGRATVAALHLNSDLAVLVRMNWIKAGWHPPTDA